MRIVLVSQEYPPDTAHGGIASQTHRKAHGLAALGHDVHVLSRSVGADRREEPGDGVAVTRLGPPFGGAVSHTDIADWVAHSTHVAAELARWHEERPIDIIDFPEYGAEGYVHLLNRTEWNHVPVVIQLHGPLAMLAAELGWPDADSELHRVGTHMEATCVRLADGVYSSSATSADWCARSYGVDRSAIPVIHAGVDVDRFRPGRRDQDPRPTVAFVGRIARSKGVDALVDAAVALAPRHPGLCVRLIGRDDGGLGAELVARAAAAGIPDLVDLAGFVTGDHLPIELCRAHVFAAPSVYEGGPGFVYLEAMACGLPVVACSGSGVDETISDGRTGALVPSGDLDALVRALDRLLADESARVAMGAAARQFVLEHADSRACLQQLESFYADTVEGGS